ncbi:MAG TPA: L,D-transpeptidase family protein [Solirubrobacteraceae bacterium]
MIGIGSAVALLVVLVVVVLVVDASRSDRIAEGIRIGSLDVGGLNPDQARARVRQKLAPRARRPVTVAYQSQRFLLRPQASSMALKLDVDGTVEAARKRGLEGNAFSRVLGGGSVNATVPAQVRYSHDALAQFVARVARRVDRGARDADIDMRNGKLERSHARNGVTVQRAQLKAALVHRLADPAGSRTVKLPVKVTERPDRTLADLKKRYPRVIGIDRDAKVLRLYKNLLLERRFHIAVGKAGLESSPGRYKIEEKIVNPPWHAPNKAWAGALAGKTIPAGDPRNPLQARWLGYHDGEGIHGTSDIASLGTAASHGCIRMSPNAVKELYRQVKVGTPVFLQ